MTLGYSWCHSPSWLWSQIFSNDLKCILATWTPKKTILKIIDAQSCKSTLFCNLETPRFRSSICGVPVGSSGHKIVCLHLPVISKPYSIAIPGIDPISSISVLMNHSACILWFYGVQKWTDSTVYTGLQHKQIQYSAMFWRGVDCMETGNKLVNIYIYKCSLYASIHPSIHLSSAYHIYIRVFVCAQWIVHKCS